MATTKIFLNKREELDKLYIKKADLEDELDDVRKKLKTAKQELEDICPNHEYIAEHNGDYHNSGFYYTCKHCTHFTMIRPR